MWARNLLFISLCGVGLAALGASLSPEHKPLPRAVLPSQTPAGSDLNATVTRLNQAFRQSWTQQGLTPVAPADDLTSARRLSLALVGAIPSLEEIRLLEAQPPAERLDWMLSGIFADRRHHDYLAERLARAYVGTQDGPFVIYRRRRFVSWLADELAVNRPYNELVERLIAGEGIWTDEPSTNFITVTIKPDQKTGPDEAELAARVSRAFLGARIDCAECHDHPFEPWKQADFQGLAAFFGDTQQGFTGIYDEAGKYEVEDRVTGETKAINPCLPFQTELAPAEGGSRKRLAAWVTHPKNVAFGRAIANRMWGLMFGRPLVEPIDDIRAGADLPSALDILAEDFTSHGYDLRRLIAIIASSEAFKLDSRGPAGGPDATEEQEQAWAVFPVTRLRPEQVVGGLLQATSLETIDYQSHILTRVARQIGQNEFIQRYGDSGEEEFMSQGGTIPQRLLMMNGKLLNERIQASGINSVSVRLGMLAPSDAKAVEIAYLAVLTRRPSEAEASRFNAPFADATRNRNQRLEDLYWTLLNCTEFSWNH